MSEKQIKELQERRKEINKEIKYLRDETSSYEGEVEFPLVVVIEARGYSRRCRKLESFRQHELPYTVLSLGWKRIYDASNQWNSLMVYLGNKIKPVATRYRMEIKITPLEEEPP
jgi:hypothetical protein